MSTTTRHTATRGGRTARRRLAREIATFVSPAERLELASLLDRYREGGRPRVRTLLERQALPPATPDGGG
jgi:hypothetical protein